MISNVPRIVMGVLSLALTAAGGLAVAQTAAPLQAKSPPPPIRAQPNPADAIFAAWDADHNGSLSPQEFRAGWQRAQQVVQGQNRLRQQFAALDVNKSGAIEASEYGNLVLIKQAGKSAPPLARFDANKDGKLQLAEYRQLVLTLAPREAGKRK